MTTTQSTAPDEVPLVLESSPELIFRVARPVAEGEAVSSSMPVGPWLNGPTGRPLAGALGVLVDNVLGYAIMLHRPPGGWLVGAEISADLCGPVPGNAATVPEGLTGVLGVPSAAADGSTRLDLAVTSDLANPHGNLHGGITLFACDLVAQAALAAVAGPSQTTSIHVAYPRPIPAGTTVRFEGRILHRGRAFAVIQVTALNESGKPCVIATVTTGAAA
jgi:uncharacterized protein (TIGR00369 family)